MKKIFIYLIVLMCVHCTVGAQNNWTETPIVGNCATGAIVNTGLNGFPGDQYVFGPDGSVDVFGVPCTVHIDSWTIDVSACTPTYDFGAGPELIVELLVDGVQVFEGPDSGIPSAGGILDVEAWFTTNGYGYGESGTTWEVIVGGAEQAAGVPASCSVDATCNFTVACAEECASDCVTLTGGGTTCENLTFSPFSAYTVGQGSGSIDVNQGDGSGSGCWSFAQFSNPFDPIHAIEAGAPVVVGNTEILTFCSEFTSTGDQAAFPTFESIFGNGACFGESTLSLYDATGCVDQTTNGVTITQPVPATSTAASATGLVPQDDYVVCYELDYSGATTDVTGAPCVQPADATLVEFCMDIVMNEIVVAGCPTFDFAVATPTVCSGDDIVLSPGPTCDIPANAGFYVFSYTGATSFGPITVPPNTNGFGPLNTANPGLQTVQVGSTETVCTDINYIDGTVILAGISNPTCDPINAYFVFVAADMLADVDLDGGADFNPACPLFEISAVVLPEPQRPTINGANCTLTLNGACPGDVLTVTSTNPQTATGNGTSTVTYSPVPGDPNTVITVSVDNTLTDFNGVNCPDTEYEFPVAAIETSGIGAYGPFCVDDPATDINGGPPIPGENAYGSVIIDLNGDSFSAGETTVTVYDANGTVITTVPVPNGASQVVITDILLNTTPQPLGTYAVGDFAGNPNIASAVYFEITDSFGDGMNFGSCTAGTGFGDYAVTDGQGNVLVPVTPFDGPLAQGSPACCYFAAGCYGGAGGPPPNTDNYTGVIGVDYILQSSGTFGGLGVNTDQGADIGGGNALVNDGESTFDPVLAGPGEHGITFTFEDQIGCIDVAETYIDVYEYPIITLLGEPVCSADQTTYSVTFDVTNISTATWNQVLDSQAAGSDLSNTPGGADDPTNPAAGSPWSNDGVTDPAFAFTVTVAPSGTPSAATINADGTITITDVDIADLASISIGTGTENNGCISALALTQPVVCPVVGGCSYDLVGAADNICESDVEFTVQVTDNGAIIADLSDPLGDGTAVVWSWDVTLDGVALAIPGGGLSLDATNNLVFAMNDGATFNTPAGTYVVTYTHDGGTAGDTSDDCSATDIVVVVGSPNACDVPITIPAAACYVADIDGNGTADFEDGMTALGTLPDVAGYTGVWTMNGTVVTDGAGILAAISGPGSYSLQYTVGQDLCQTECSFTITALDCDCPLDVAGIQTVCDNAGGTYDVIVTVAGGAATGYNVNGVATDISSGQFTVNFPQGNGSWTITLDSDDTLCDYTLQGEEPECCTLPVATIDDATTCVGSNGQFNLTSLFNGADGGGVFFIDPFDAAANPVSPATAPAVDPANGTISVVGDVITYIPGSVTAETTVDVAYSVGVAGCASLDYATVTLVPQPMVDIDLPSSICLGDTLLLTDYVVAPTTGYDVIAWTSTAGTIDAVAGTFIPDAVGNVTICYSETVTSTDGLAVCTAEDCEVLGVTSNNADLGEDITVCAGSNGFYNLTSFFINGDTDLGGTFTTTSTDGTLAGNIFSYDAGTAATLTADIVYTVCNNSDTVVLTILPAPLVDLDITSCICVGEADIDLTAYLVAPTTGLGTGVWTADAGTIDAAAGIYTPAVVGNVTVCYEETITGADGTTCSAIDCEVLCVEANPVATINPVVVCADQCAVDLTQMLDTLATTGGIFSAPNMEFTVAGDVLSCTVGAITAETVIDIEYSVGTPDGCADIQTSTITLVPSPVVDIDLPSSICLGDTLLLTDYVVAPTTGFDVIAWTSTAGTIDAVAGTFIPDAVGNVTICYSETVTSTDGSTVCAAEDCEVLGVTSNNADLGEDVTVCAGSNGFYNLTSFFINGDTDLGGTFTTTSTDGTLAGNIFTYDAETTDTLIADIVYTVCNNSDTVTLTILPAPVADLDLPSAFCNEETPIVADYIVDVTTAIGVVWTVADAAGNDISGIIQADGSLDLTGLDENITICYTQETTVNGTTCDDTDCEVVLIYPAVPADLIIDGADQATYCIDDFRDNEVIDLTSYLNDGVGGSGFFTITHSDGTIATDCIDGPSTAGCLDGFIWTLDTLGVGTITITYTTNNDQQTCPFTESIEITLIEPATDCLNVPSIVCENEADELIDASEWYDAACGDCIKTWNSVTDGAQDVYSIETYTNQAPGTYDPNSIPGCTTFVDPGMATNSVALPQVPTGATILSFDLTWDYQPTCELAEGDIDTAYISMPDGSIIELYANAGGPGENGNDHFGSQTVSYAWDGTTFASDGNPLFPATIDPVQFTSCAAQPVVSYFLGSNAANFTIGFEANITWATCVFEAYLHELWMLMATKLHNPNSKCNLWHNCWFC